MAIVPSRGQGNFMAHGYFGTDHFDNEQVYMESESFAFGKCCGSEHYSEYENKVRHVRSVRSLFNIHCGFCVCTVCHMAYRDNVDNSHARLLE